MTRLFSFAFVLLLPTLVLADAAADPGLPSLAGELLEAVVHGQWWAAAAVLVTMLLLGLRQLPWEPIRTVPAQVVGAFVLAALGGVLHALAAGAGVSGEVLATALKIGAASGAAAGGLPALLEWWRGRMPPTAAA